MAQNVSLMNNVSSIVIGIVLLSAGFWFVFSGRTRETVVGVMCMIVGTFFVATMLADFVWGSV